jgi:LysR family transcriptional regulator, glycine cleavage system transcriptional activator
MIRRLPPLSAVRVFEAAARHENFTSAANELGMTQAAVSHQIRLLEDRLGLQLFTREKRRVHLTEAARRVAAAAGRGLDMIESAFAELRAEDEATLTVSTTPTFANAWLAWRLGGFQMAHPDTAVRLVVSAEVSDFNAGAVDVAIRSGRGDWDDGRAEALMPIEFTPMCSPAFLAARGGSIMLEDLPNLPLISPDEPSWARWLADAGLDAGPVRLKPGVRMDSEANEGHAAMAGLGVAMLTPFFWASDMAEGKLVRLFDQTSTLGQGYWIVAPEHRWRSPKIARFREWLHAEIGKSQAALIPRPA